MRVGVGKVCTMNREEREIANQPPLFKLLSEEACWVHPCWEGGQLPFKAKWCLAGAGGMIPASCAVLAHLLGCSGAGGRGEASAKHDDLDAVCRTGLLQTPSSCPLLLQVYLTLHRTGRGEGKNELEKYS